MFASLLNPIKDAFNKFQNWSPFKTTIMVDNNAPKKKKWNPFKTTVTIGEDPVAPTPAPTAMPTPTPTPMPIPQQKIYRNPKWDNWKNRQPKRYSELLSGTEIASNKYGVPQDLLMDISGLETSGTQNLNQLGGGPGQGYFQFEPETLQDLKSNIDPYSATESAGLAARLISQKNLSRWGTPDYPGKPRHWGTLDNPNNQNGSLVHWYDKDELNKYLSDIWKIK